MTNPALAFPVVQAFTDRFQAPLHSHLSEELTSLLRNVSERVTDVAQRSVWIPEPNVIYASKRLSIGTGVLVSSVMLPRNLYRLESEPGIINRVYDFIETSVVPIHSIPSAEIARDLLGAETEDELKEVVSDNEAELLATCDALVFGCDQDNFADEISHYSEAHAAFEIGLYRAAQTTIAGLIDAGMFRRSRTLELNRKHLLSHDNSAKAVTKRNSLLDEMAVSEWAVWMTVWNAYSEFHGHKGDPPPTIFNRHGCAHSVGECQFSRVNAVIGFMIAASVVGLLDKFDE